MGKTQRRSNGNVKSVPWLFLGLYVLLSVAIKGGFRAARIRDNYVQLENQRLEELYTQEEAVYWSGRHLLQDFPDHRNCTPPSIFDFPNDFFSQEERKQGGVLFHVVICCYLLYALAIICDDYFVPALERLCDDLELSSDVAGATFMAAATSAPELFTNVIGTFITEGDIGVGTIVGSAVFNILAVAACCGLCTNQVIQLDWWPLTRDCIAYGISVVLLIVFIFDSKVEWWESLILVLAYFGYILVMCFNERLKEFAMYMAPKMCWSRCCTVPELEDATTEVTPLLGKNGDAENGRPVLHTILDRQLSTHLIAERQMSTDHELIKKALMEEEKLDEEMIGPFTLPRGKGWKTWLYWIVTWPINLGFFLTIPDCRNERWIKLYPFAFTMCVLWIGFLSYMVAWMMTIIGFTIGVPDSVMGLTFLAAGTSLPEAVSSVIVTRQGLGSMGLSNSIGSNTFDILLCLGLPWLVRASFFPVADADEHFIQIYSTGIEFSAIILLSSLVVLYLIFLFNGFRLGTRVGITALVMYAIFLVFASLFELNVFFLVNLPTCVADNPF